MSLLIDFVNFKNILLENNINLFDHDLRISYHRLNNFTVNKNQKGGSINSNNKDITQKIKSMTQIHLLHLVNSLLVKNNEKTNWIFELY